MRPPRYKLAIINWLAIYPLITLILWLAAPIVSVLPIYVTTLFVSLILVSLMTFVIMPLLLRAFAPWLTRKAPSAQGE